MFKSNEDFRRLNFTDSVKATGVMISCNYFLLTNEGQEVLNKPLLWSCLFFISVHRRRSIGIIIYKGKCSAYIAIFESTVEIQGGDTSSASACLVHKNTFVSASSWSQTNSDIQLIKSFFRLNLKSFEPQFKKQNSGRRK